MALYKKNSKNSLSDEIGSYEEMERDIWEDNKKISRKKSGSITRK
ncbi:hypothetical protein [Picrophilus oshimae]|uniref:Uncharacterized protein n=1 Tax=Picrophilus torridus (strain ATCC 700027 / DSM 9790 / JCM 10055 / NBRC 100828 / KAW 2/3) TaxID=1122961 RepID=A0A8G2FX78_PICTO|nr:hypothetical protein [Picrophilus oshimae]SMD31134.1 hypothetical protein SAMN02745355_1055 [Picrophilus oshimae DSM 9789]